MTVGISVFMVDAGCAKTIEAVRHRKNISTQAFTHRDMGRTFLLGRLGMEVYTAKARRWLQKFVPSQIRDYATRRVEAGVKSCALSELWVFRDRVPCVTS